MQCCCRRIVVFVSFCFQFLVCDYICCFYLLVCLSVHSISLRAGMLYLNAWTFVYWNLRILVKSYYIFCVLIHSILQNSSDHSHKIWMWSVISLITSGDSTKWISQKIPVVWISSICLASMYTTSLATPFLSHLRVLEESGRSDWRQWEKFIILYLLFVWVIRKDVYR